MTKYILVWESLNAIHPPIILVYIPFLHVWKKQKKKKKQEKTKAYNYDPNGDKTTL